MRRCLKTTSDCADVTCTVCKDKRVLTVHERVHSGEQTYSCAVCQCQFAQYVTLKQHELTHTLTADESSNCSMCSYKCASLSDLQQHVMSSHTEKQSATCDTE